MTDDKDTQEDNANNNQTNIDGDFVQGDKVGADKIGRDKITIGDIVVNDNAWRKKAVIAVAVVVLILGAMAFAASKLLKQPVEVVNPVTVSEIENPVVVIQLTDTPTPIPTATSEPTATPKPFEPAAEGEALIIVLPFHLAANTPSSEAHRLIYAAIKERLEELGLDDVRVELDPHTILDQFAEDEARALGERYDAAVVIFGEESRSTVTVNFLNIKEPKVAAGNEQVYVDAPETLVGAQFIRGHLAGQLTFLSLFAVGQAVVAEGELAMAIPIMEAAVANISEEMIAEEMAAPEAAADAYFRLGWLYLVPPTQTFQEAAMA